MAALISLGGCAPAEQKESDTGGSGTVPESTATTAAPETSDAPEMAASKIAGVVKFAGPKPERKVIKMDEECIEHWEGKPLLSDQLVISNDGGLRWAFAYISTPPEGDYSVPEEAAILEQSGCAYVQHVVGLQVGQTLSVVNSDPFTHNVRGFSRKNRPFNMGQPAGSEPRTPRASSTETVELAIQIKCDVHSWMTGFMFLLDHPFYAISDENGNFEIEGLPDGEYDLTIWHETLGEQVVHIAVKQGAASAEITFEA
jgi:hypothetical protein